MKKLFSVDPTRIGRPDGPAAADAIPEALLEGTPAALRTQLEHLLGPERVLHRVVDLVRYASDASPYRLVPQVVVEAHDASDIAKVLKFCGKTGRHATFRAAGTSLNGQSQSDDILIDVRKHFTGILSITPGGATIKARAGTILAHANVHLSCHGRKIGPDPASANVCTLGGVASNNAGGMRCRVSQDAYHTVASMTFVTASGTRIDTADANAEQQFALHERTLASGLEALKAEIMADPALVERIRRKYSIRNTHGYRLDAFLDGDTPLEIFRRLLIGAEGTLGFISDVTFDTVPSAPIKAEHGMGLNMAPFLEQEWGERATLIMWKVKQLADPHGVLAPNVILTRDDQVHLKGLKTQPGIESTANASLCIECGFCEAVCPSRNVTMTPRQRIVVRREMARQPEGSAVLRRLQEQYQYDAIQTCAGDSTCALPCPIEIDTGALMRTFRQATQTEASEATARFVAQSWNGVERASKVALRGAKYMAESLGWKAVRAVVETARRVASDDVVPSVPGPMPQPARALPVTRREHAHAVYFTACVNRMFGRDPDVPADALSIQEALIAVSWRAGKKLWIPDDIGGTCCATPFSSKGYASARQIMAETTLERLWKWSDEGRLPVVVDAASCTHGLVHGLDEVLTPEQQARRQRLKILDSITWCASLLPELEVYAPLGKIVIHPTCAMSHLKLTQDLKRIAVHMAAQVEIPVGATCCGTAGDRGLLHPELVISATRDEKAYLEKVHADAYVCANRTCEMGLKHAMGRPYESFLFSLEAATRNPGV